MRREVYFQNDPCFTAGKGRDFNASDVVYSWQREVPDRNFKGMITRSPSDSVEFKIISDFKVQVRFNQPRMSFISMLTRTFAYIIPHEAVEFYGERIMYHPVGTGPFRLINWDKAKSISLVKNPNYWQQDQRQLPMPYLDGLNYIIQPDEIICFNEFVQKRIHICSIPAKLYFTIIDSSNYRLKNQWQEKDIRILKSAGCLNTSFILMASYDRFELPPFSDAGHLLAKTPALRHAINYAIDRQSLIEQHYPGGQAEAASGFLTPGLNPKRKWGFSFSPEKAKSLLRDAGFAEGKNLPQFKMVISSTSKDLQTARSVCKQLKKFGINIQLITAPFSEIRNAVRQNKAEMEWNGWIADFPDAINFIETVDLNTDEIDAQIDLGKRRQLIAEWEAEYLRKAPRIFLHHRSGTQLLVQNEVTNLFLSPLSIIFYKYVSLQK